MKKFSSSNLTVGMLGKNFKETIETLVTLGKGFVFMNTIKETHAFWKRFQLEVLEMIRKLGCPTFFMTLSCAYLNRNNLIPNNFELKRQNISEENIKNMSSSCAYLNRNNLIRNIFELKRQNITEENIKNMSYFQKCEILNENPEFAARHFQYTVEVFFTEILMGSDHFGEIKYAIRVYIQFCGSPYVHSFLWILNPVKLSKEIIKEYVAFLNQTLHSFLLDQTVDKELYDL